MHGLKNIFNGPRNENLLNFNSFIRNELPYETYLELALEYVNQGLDEEAIRVLEQSPPYPIVYYWLAYLYRNVSTKKQSISQQGRRNVAFPCIPVPVGNNSDTYLGEHSMHRGKRPIIWA